MRRSDNFRLPPAQKEKLEKASRLEWITVIYLISVIVLMYLVMGSSQAMKAAWLEDSLSLVPPLTFLITSKFFDKQSNARFPFGYHSVVTIGFLIGSVALLVMGAFLVGDSLMSLASAEHPTIGTMELFGFAIWQGWVMIAVLAYSVVPISIIGHLKLPLANEIHDKQLFTDAKMNKADWLTGAAAILGVLGIGMGWWWADAVAATIIGLDVLHDGVKNTRHAFGDLMASTPTSPDQSEVDPAVREAQERLRGYDWVEAAELRMREEGHVFFVDAFVVPRPDTPDVVDRIVEAIDDLRHVSWKIHEVSITPVREIPSHLIAEDPPLARYKGTKAKPETETAHGHHDGTWPSAAREAS